MQWEYFCLKRKAKANLTSPKFGSITVERSAAHDYAGEPVEHGAAKQTGTPTKRLRIEGPQSFSTELYIHSVQPLCRLNKNFKGVTRSLILKDTPKIKDASNLHRQGGVCL